MRGWGEGGWCVDYNRKCPPGELLLHAKKMIHLVTTLELLFIDYSHLYFIKIILFI